MKEIERLIQKLEIDKEILADQDEEAPTIGGLPAAALLEMKEAAH